jgi:hypothetical protein
VLSSSISFYRAYFAYFVYYAVVFLFLCTVAALPVAFANQAASPRALSAEQAAEDVRILKRALSELHPALTKYRTPAEMDAAFTKFETRGNAARTATDMYLAATELAAAIRCGHTWTNTLNQSGNVKAMLMEGRNKLPFLLVPVENRWLITASAIDGIAVGDELISINGVGGSDIITRMMPYLRADGSSDVKRLIQLSHDRNDTSMMDLVWPLLEPPSNGSYAIEVRRANERIEKSSVNTMTLAERRGKLPLTDVPSGSAAIDEAWTFKIENNMGILTLPTFSFWRSKFDWAKFLDKAFAELNAKKVPHLIIDIRRNEGGDGAINRAILSHLVRTPFTWPATQSFVAYERTPDVLVKHLDTWDVSFFDRTGRVEKISDRRYRYKTPSIADRTITPTATPYSGKTLMLVSGENSSATFQLAYLAKLSGAAKLIGQSTGGNLRGLNGGELAWVTLPNSGVAVDIPLVSSVPLEPQADASITPDSVVKKSFAARATGQDLEMAAARQIIAHQ